MELVKKTCCLLLVILLFVLKSCLCTGIVPSNVYVSKNGKDVSGCGSLESFMCASIEFALRNFDSPNITIYLDGGRDKVFRYTITETIIIDSILQMFLLKLPSSEFSPVILSKANESLYLFSFYFSSRPNIVFKEVEFENMLFLRFNGHYKQAGHIRIKNCKCDGPFSAGYPMILVNSTRINVIFKDLYLNNSRQLINQFQYSDTNPSTLQIENSFLLTSALGYQLVIGGGLLNIKNTVIKVVSPFGIYGSNKILIQNISFTSKGNIANLHQPLMTIVSCTVGRITDTIFQGIYSNNAQLVFIEGNTNFTFQNCSFIDIQMPTILHLTGAGPTFKYCNFKRLNTSQVFLVSAGGNNFILENCIFENIQSCVANLSSVDNFGIIDTHFKKCENVLFVTGTHAWIKNGTFIENKSTRLSYSYFALLISDSHFIDNDAPEGTGGGLSLTRGELHIKRSTFIGNKATSGGALSLTNVTAIIENSTFISPKTQSFNSNTSIQFFASILETKGLPIIFDNIQVQILNTMGNSIDIITGEILGPIKMQFTCPMGKNAIVQNNKLWSCESCQRGKYSLHRGQFNTINNSSGNVTVHCKDCPFGGECENGMVRSRGNFWGYADESFNVYFISCPEGYCCGKNALGTDYQRYCTGINTCNWNREGKICGRCKTSYHIDFLTDECIPNERCDDPLFFWLIFLFVGLLLFTVVIYFEKIVKLLQTLSTKKSTPRQAYQGNSPFQSDEIISPLVHQNDYDIKNDDETLRTGEENNDNTFIGLLKVLINFYQINLLITVSPPAALKKRNTFLSDIIPSLANLKPTFKNISTTICPIEDLGTVTRLFLIELSFPIYLITLSLFFISYQLLLQLMKKKILKIHTEIDTPPCSFVIKCKIFIVRVLLIGYKNVAFISLTLVNCVRVKGELILVIDGEVSCYTTPYQYLLWFFIVLWILPYSLNVYVACRMLRSRVLTTNQFFFCLAVPIYTLIGFMRFQLSNNHWNSGLNNPCENEEYDQIRTVFEYPFRNDDQFEDRRQRDNHLKSVVLWDGVILFRCCVLTVLAIFLRSPIVRLPALILMLLCFCFHHSYIAPYRSKQLNVLETVCFYCLIFLGCINLFWAFFYVYSLPLKEPASLIGEIFYWFNRILELTPLFILVAIGSFYATRQFFRLLYKKCLCKHV